MTAPNRSFMRRVAAKRAVCLCFLICACLLPQVLSGAPPPPQSGAVVKVFDGDTVQLGSGEKVRYLGIDAPEVDHECGGRKSGCYGLEAWSQNRKWVLHQVVKLEYDGQKRDRYGRLLAYVRLPDGRCVNRELLRAGYAWVFRTENGFSRLDTFLEAQREAIRNRRGLWGHCPVKVEARYVGNRKSYVFHRPNCPFGRRTGASSRVEFSSRWLALEQGYRPCRRCLP